MTSISLIDAQDKGAQNVSIFDTATMRDALKIDGQAEPNGGGYILCPFRLEKTPSLHLVGEKGRETGFTCFGCGENGGIADYLIKRGHAKDAHEAAQLLERHLGISLGLLTFEDLKRGNALAGRSPKSQKQLCERSSLGVMTDEDLFAVCSAHESWLVDGLVRESGILLLSARPKVGKSELARNLAKAVATGSDFLGRRCKKGSVLWIGLEEAAAHLKERCGVMGLTGLGIRWVTQAPAGDPADWLRQVVKAYKPSLVIIDTIGRLLRIEDINHYSQVGRATQVMLDLRAEHRTTFCAIHHNNRSDSTLGSIQWEAFCDCIMLLSRGPENQRFIRTVQRGGVAMDATLLKRDDETGEILVAESKVVTDQRVAEQRILDTAASLGRAATREELAKRCGRQASIGRAAVDGLVVTGLLVTSGTGTRSDPRLYSLADSPTKK